MEENRTAKRFMNDVTPGESKTAKKEMNWPRKFYS
jgi:hypothetical protein